MCCFHADNRVYITDSLSDTEVDEVYRLINVSDKHCSCAGRKAYLRGLARQKAQLESVRAFNPPTISLDPEFEKLCAGYPKSTAYEESFKIIEVAESERHIGTNAGYWERIRKGPKGYQELLDKKS